MPERVGRRADPTPEMALWLLCLAAGHVARRRGPAAEPLAELQRRHALLLPSAQQAWREVSAILDKYGVELQGGPLTAARWPSAERVEVEQRAQVRMAPPAA